MNSRSKAAPEVIELDFSRPVKLRGNRVGKVVGWSEAEGPVVDHSSNPHGPIAARTAVPMDAETAANAIERDQEVLLVFEAERSDRPIIVGLLQTSHGPAEADTQTPEELVAVVDGKRISLEAQEEIVLRCGEASITLQRDGRVVVRGVYVETRSKGVNRIKGGMVRIN